MSAADGSWLPWVFHQIIIIIIIMYNQSEILNQIPSEFHELVQLYAAAPQKAVTRITGSNDASKVFHQMIGCKDVEHVAILCLDCDNKIIAKKVLAVGGDRSVVMDPKVIFRFAILNRAQGVLISHNHPSGKARPSQADKKVTKKLVTVGEALDCKLLDHIVTTPAGHYYSFADECDL